jgi:hypothetical protein
MLLLPLHSIVVVLSAQLSAEALASSIDPQPAETCRHELPRSDHPSEFMRLWLLLKSNFGQGSLLPERENQISTAVSRSGIAVKLPFYFKIEQRLLRTLNPTAIATETESGMERESESESARKSPRNLGRFYEGTWYCDCAEDNLAIHKPAGEATQNPGKWCR